MSQSPSASQSPSGRARRSDAERSIEAILDAAVATLADRPDASLGDIARTAGVSRQTVHAHFRTRDDLVGAVYDRATGEVVSALDEAELDAASAVEALTRLLDASWQAFERYPFLIDESLPRPGAAEERSRHVPIADRLGRIIERGRRSGEFAAEAAVPWLVAATIGIGHAGGEEVAGGRMSADEARLAVRRSVLDVLGAG